MKVLAVTHGSDVGPELFTDVAREEGHDLSEWQPGGDEPPLLDFDAVVIFGGHQNVGEEDKYPWLVSEYEAIRVWVAASVPLFGVCLGGQMLAHAMGGRVVKMDETLAGFYETTLTPEGRRDPVLGALPPRVQCFNGNGYRFEIPDTAVMLAEGPVPQAFRVGDAAWGVQFHPELKRFSVGSWFQAHPRHGARIEELRTEFQRHLPVWKPLGSALFRAFLREADRCGRRH